MFNILKLQQCVYIDGLLQERRNSRALALELRLSGTDHQYVTLNPHFFTKRVEGLFVSLVTCDDGIR